MFFYDESGVGSTGFGGGFASRKNYVVFGMGLGYHVIELLKKYPENKVTVLESEKYLLLQALRYMDWTTYFKENRIELYMSRI